jgi:phosphatidylserine decarboxylase
MIAREGLYLILIGLILTIGLVLAATRWDSRVAFALSLIFGCLTMFTVYFFRDPSRSIKSEDGMLLAPADGRVIGIEMLSHDPYLGGGAQKVSIFLSVFDVHVNRVPASGRIDYVRYNPGKFFAAFKNKASQLNEQTEIGMITAAGPKIIFKQIAGLIARRIVCRLKEGGEVDAGERFGMIRFGSRVELIVPARADIRVRVGEHVTGGQSVVGYLPVEPSNSEYGSNDRGRNVEI